MSNYIGEFTSINGTPYKVQISTSKGTGNTTITLGGTPFVTSMKGNDKNIYLPLTTSSATIEVLTKDYYFDLYAGQAQSVKVVLTNISNSEIEWMGYVTPCLFNQGFKEESEVIEIECVDSIASLENIIYRSNEKSLLTFLQILTKILIPYVGARYLYVSDNLQLNSATGTETILDKLSLSEMNFFDEKSDEGATDDDVAWTCSEVLEEICKYLGYTLTLKGQDVFLLDYDSIKSNNPYYYRYDLTKYTKNGDNYTLSSSPSRVQVKDTHKIIGNDHASSDASVSLDSVYNKVSVQSDTYTIDDTIADITANQNNITCSDATAQGLGVRAIDAEFFETIKDDENPNALMAVWMDVHNDSAAHGGGKHNYTDFVACKWFNNPNTRFWVYDNNWNDVTSKFTGNMTYSMQKFYNSACMVKYFTKNVSKDKTSKSSQYAKLLSEYYKAHKNDPNITSADFLDKLAKIAGISSISWSDAIFISVPYLWSNYEKRVSKPEDLMAENMKYPMFQIECEGSFAQGSDKSAAIIQGDVYYHCIGGSNVADAYAPEKNGFKLDKENWIYPPDDMFITASIQWGNLWWNGEDWQTTKCGFKLNFMSEVDRDNTTKGKKETIDAWKVSKSIMEYKPITNTVSWRFGTSETGHLVTMPTQTNVSGKPILTIYRPHQQRLWKSRKDFNNGDKTQKVRWPSVFYAIKNLKFKSITGDPTYSGVNESDTIYTNILDNNSIDELDTIKMKVHTFDSKDNSYGSVCLNGGSAFVDTLYNKALHSKEKTWYNYKGELATNGLRAEEHLVYKLCNQYEEPSKILEFELHNGIVKPYGLYTDTSVSGSYIPLTIETDYKMNSCQVKLIEKK